jgi:hypothetical protein
VHLYPLSRLEHVAALPRETRQRAHGQYVQILMMMVMMVMMVMMSDIT